MKILKFLFFKDNERIYTYTSEKYGVSILESDQIENITFISGDGLFKFL